MTPSITLAVDVPAEPAQVFATLSTTEGQRGFWTADADVSPDRARFGFPQAGFPFWEGSTWEWELGAPARAETGTGVLFRHHGFGAGYPETDLGHTAHPWAQILDRLVAYHATGTAQPLFPAES